MNRKQRRQQRKLAIWKRTWRQRDRELEARSRVGFLPTIKPIPVLQPPMDMIVLSDGTRYWRLRLTLAQILQGRKATMPWRKVTTP